VNPIEATEREADEFMRERGLLGEDCYTEKGLERKARAHETAVAPDTLAVLAEVSEAFLGSGPDTLQSSELIALGRVAGLTEHQQRVWELAVYGFGHQEIADLIGLHSRQAAFDVLHKARVRLLACSEAQEYFGIWEVYVELINRICKARPCKRHADWRKYYWISQQRA